RAGEARRRSRFVGRGISRGGSGATCADDQLRVAHRDRTSGAAAVSRLDLSRARCALLTLLRRSSLLKTKPGALRKHAKNASGMHEHNVLTAGKTTAL